MSEHLRQGSINLHYFFTHEDFWRGVELVKNDFLEQVKKSRDIVWRQTLGKNVIQKLEALGADGQAVMHIYESVLRSPPKPIPVPYVDGAYDNPEYNWPKRHPLDRLVGGTSQNEESDLLFFPICHDIATQQRLVKDAQAKFLGSGDKDILHCKPIRQVFTQRPDVIILIARAGFAGGIVLKHLLRCARSSLFEKGRNDLACQLATPKFICADFADRDNRARSVIPSRYSPFELEFLVDKLADQLRPYLKSGKEKILYADDFLIGRNYGSTYQRVHGVVERALGRLFSDKAVCWSLLRPLEWEKNYIEMPLFRFSPFLKVKKIVHMEDKDIETIGLERGHFHDNPVAWLVDKVKYQILKQAGCELGEELSKAMLLHP